MKYVISNAAGNFEEKWFGILKRPFKIKKYVVPIRLEEPTERKGYDRENPDSKWYSLDDLAYYAKLKIEYQTVYTIQIDQLSDFESLFFWTENDLIWRKDICGLHPQVINYLAKLGVSQEIEIYDYYVE